jgi:fumarate reductase subunit D
VSVPLPAEHRRRAGPDRAHGLAWAAFANAAILEALVVPAIILVLGVLAPLGLVPAFDRHYSSLSMALNDPLVKVCVLLLAGAVFYVAAWRAAYVLHELGVHAQRALFTVCFGLAGLGVLGAAYVLFAP